MATLHLARMEAIRRGERVAVCRSSDGQTCADSGGWEQGWIVFVDDRNSGEIGKRDSGEEILLVQERLDHVTISSTNRRNPLVYSPTGFLYGVGARTFTICGQTSGDYGRKVVLNKTGRVRLEEGVSCR